MKFCGECGAQVEDGALFCEECGAVIESVAEPTEGKVIEPKSAAHKSTKSKTNKGVLIPVALVVIILVVVLVLSGRNTNKNRTTNDYESAESVAKEVVAEQIESGADNAEDEMPAEESTPGMVTLTAENIKNYYGLWSCGSNRHINITPSSWTEDDDIEIILFEEEYGTCEPYITLTVNSKELNHSTLNMQLIDYEGYEYDVTLEFTEEGIYAEGKDGSWPERTLFTLKGQNGLEGNKEGGFYGEVTLEVIDQYSDDNNTYLVVSKFDGTETWIICVEGILDERYTDCYIEAVDYMVYPNLYCKGYPICDVALFNPDTTIITYDEYWGLDDSTSEYDDTWWTDTTQNDIGYLQPPADFTEPYDTCFYDENTGLWIFSYTTSNKRPFQMTGIDMLTWTAGEIGFIGRIQNTDTVEHSTVRLAVMLCGKDGQVLFNESSWAVYCPYGYYIKTDGMTESFEVSWPEGFTASQKVSTLTIPAGEEAVFSRSRLQYTGIDITSITAPIKYIYVELETYD